MSNKTAGIVDVDGLPYEWALRSEPSWGDAQGWRGMTIAPSSGHPARSRAGIPAAPAPDERPPARTPSDQRRARLTRICAALQAGWDPESRGKTMYFAVDADGN
jgi:hypothetical protein